MDGIKGALARLMSWNVRFESSMAGGWLKREALLGGRTMDARRLTKREWCPGEDSNFHALSGTRT